MMPRVNQKNPVANGFSLSFLVQLRMPEYIQKNPESRYSTCTNLSETVNSGLKK